MHTKSMHTDALVTEYVHVLNQALGENKHNAVVAKAIELSSHMLKDKRVRMEVYSDDPDKVHDHFMLRFHDQHFELAGHGKEQSDFTWSVPRDHVEEVVDNPRDFIDHPAKLDLDWLKRRVADA